MKKLFLFSNIASHYRTFLWSKILSYPDWEVHIYFGKDRKSGIKSIDFDSEIFCSFSNRLHKVKNYYFFGNILFWQKGVISSCLKLKFNQAIFTGDMYCLSTWFAVIICKMRGIQVTLWSHGLYGNENVFKLFIRKSFFLLADKHLLYEKRGKKILISKGFNPNSLYVVFNSLDYGVHKSLRNKYDNLKKSEVYPFLLDSGLPIIVFIGRLTAVKRINILIEAVKQINNESPKINLVIIGDGPEMESLNLIGRDGIDKNWLYFKGACYDEVEIGRYISKADLCISPGNVGLTAIHSLSFGTPVGTHSNFNNQMPEVEAITDGYNGFLFIENDVDDLIKKISQWLEVNSDREYVREKCFEVIDKYYNPDYQFTVLDRLLNSETPEI